MGYDGVELIIEDIDEFNAEKVKEIANSEGDVNSCD